MIFSIQSSVCAIAAALVFAVSLPVVKGDDSISPKEQMHRDMIALAHQMHDLQPQVAADEAAAALYEQLQAVYQRMSDELGGDDPGRLILSGAFDTHPVVIAPPTAGANSEHILGERLYVGEGNINGTQVTPPGCASDSGVFANGTDFLIPNFETTVSTIIVSGLEGRIWSVNSILDITHTFPDDLDITLTSPSGTTIIISSDNGTGAADGDEAFNGTLFIDDADPDGEVPYQFNNGLVTDHHYPSSPFTTLVPEEPFDAFVEEDPNGVWTLSIFDDAFHDLGTLTGWDVAIVTISDRTSNTIRTFTNDVAVTIPDGGFVARNIDVSGMGGYLCNVLVRVDITHADNNQLDISLTSPDGRSVTLTTDNGSLESDGFAGTTFDDIADPGAAGAHTVTGATFVSLDPETVLTPEESLASLRGTPVNGTWSLRVSDDFIGDVGTVQSVSLILTTCSCNEPCPSDVNGDGVTDINELLDILGGWGACP